MTHQYPPGPGEGSSGLENAIRYKTDPLSFLTEVAAAYGDIVYFQLGGEQIYLLNSPNFVRQVFGTEWRKFRKPELIKASNRGYWGDGLTTLEGDTWRTRRRLLQPTFAESKIRIVGPGIVECVQEMIAGWQPGQVVNVDAAMLALTARIAARTTFDAELEGFGAATAEVAKRSGVIRWEEALGEEFTVRLKTGDLTSAYLTRRRAGQAMDTTLAILEQRLASGEDRGDMLSFLLEQMERTGCRLTPDEVTGELLQMFFAGHHTVPTTLLWLWYALSQYPEVEARLHEEVDRVLAGRAPTVDDLPALTYGEMVIKETMRFYPLAALLPREVIQEVRIGGYTLKKGSMVWVSPYLLHHDPRNFEQPGSFQPERFSQKQARSISQYAYLPFGAGPRICIGQGLAMMVLRLILAAVAQAYRLSLIPGQPVVPKVLLTIRPDKELFMQLIVREK